MLSCFVVVVVVMVVAVVVVVVPLVVAMLGPVVKVVVHGCYRMIMLKQ